MYIFHDSHDLFFRSPFGAVPTAEKVHLKIIAPDAYNVTLRLWIDDSESTIPMIKEQDYFSAEITTPEKPCLVWYYFIINTDNTTFYYGNNAEQCGGEGTIYSHQPPSFQITVYIDNPVPEWYKNSIVYQIFPDRFYRGSDYESRKQQVLQNQNPNGPQKIIEENWNKNPEYDKDEKGDIKSWTFFGGTLKGIEEKVDYIKSLGVSAVYLNPIFKAASNHRYDTADYTQIDPLLGDEESFKHLCKVLKKRKINIILDGVFNHTGADSIYFDKYSNYGTGAYNNPQSKYYDWYRFSDDGTDYDCWWGVKDLPNVEETCPSYSDFICGDNGIVQKWLSAGASGWRLDVADELPDIFIEKIRTATKKNNKDNLLIGEVWEDASNKISYDEKRRYLFGTELDGTMNYPFRDAILSFIMNIATADILMKKMLSLKENYPKQNFYASLNLIGGHDRTRIMTILGEAENIPENEKKDFMLTEWYYAIAKKRLKMLTAIQYAMPGVPCIYYGDEAGMQGHSDPHNRRTFPWEHEDNEIMHHYRMLGVIYKEHPVLKNGDFSPFTVGDDVYGFSRSNSEETIIAIMNRHYTEHIVTSFDTDCQYALELISSEEIKITEGKLEFTVNPLTSMLILLKKQPPKREILKRSAGVICHVGSLPSGNIGKEARHFIDFLEQSGISLWQTLPLNPIGLGNSPYHSPAVFAGNPAYIDYNDLPLLDHFDEFKTNNSYWLQDYALFSTLKEKNNDDCWLNWPKNERDITNKEELIAKHSKKIDSLILDQYYFFEQWKNLKNYANEHGISIIGDIPIYVAPDSADLWAHRCDFRVNSDGHLINHAGVPPDSFTPEGQDWGNPLYNWDYMQEDGYTWWLERFKKCAERFDYIRLDHFRSFSEYFCIPQGKSPKYGVWQQGVGTELFKLIPDIGIIAEDLGILDTGVFNLLKLTGFPGMNVWQFSANEMQNMSDEEASQRIFCSGTHDNHTLLGWYELNVLENEAKERTTEAIEWLFSSMAPWVMLPIQDVLMLDDRARLNTPGTCNNINWTWRADHSMFKQNIVEYYKKLTKKTERN